MSVTSVEDRGYGFAYAAWLRAQPHLAARAARGFEFFWLFDTLNEGAFEERARRIQDDLQLLAEDCERDMYGDDYDYLKTVGWLDR